MMPGPYGAHPVGGYDTEDRTPYATCGNATAEGRTRVVVRMSQQHIDDANATIACNAWECQQTAFDSAAS
jgi:hypothetical protein